MARAALAPGGGGSAGPLSDLDGLRVAHTVPSSVARRATNSRSDGAAPAAAAPSAAPSSAAAAGGDGIVTVPEHEIAADAGADAGATPVSMGVLAAAAAAPKQVGQGTEATEDPEVRIGFHVEVRCK